MRTEAEGGCRPISGWPWQLRRPARRRGRARDRHQHHGDARSGARHPKQPGGAICRAAREAGAAAGSHGATRQYSRVWTADRRAGSGERGREIGASGGRRPDRRAGPAVRGSIRSDASAGSGRGIISAPRCIARRAADISRIGIRGFRRGSGCGVVRVLVAADSAVVRAGLEALIAQAPPLELAGSASPSSLAERVRELQPDVVLMDWRGGDEETLEPLLKAGPAVVLLTDEPDPATLAAGLRTGLRALLPHHASAEEIVAAIEAVARGLIVLHPDIIGSLQFLEQPRRSPAEVDTALTPREIEVLRMLAEGLANKNIAWQMGISEHTVKFHIASIFTKLNASSRAEAVAIGMRQGLILL